MLRAIFFATCFFVSTGEALLFYLILGIQFLSIVMTSGFESMTVNGPVVRDENFLYLVDVLLSSAIKNIERRFT